MTARRLLAWLLGLAASLVLVAAAAAHEVRPALLQVTQKSADLYEIVWKQPAVADLALRLEPRLSSGWLDRPADDQYAAPGFVIRTWTVRASEPLEGQRLAIEGLEATITDVLVEVRLAQDDARRLVVKPASPEVVFDFSAPAPPAAMAYFRLGMEHIAGGIDHLMFVTGLLLLAGLRWRVLGAVTAFTLGHSLTLGAAALGWVSAPAALIEALVALSIVMVAVEVVRSRSAEPSLLRRRPWLVALLFGLLHGFAFAGALSEIGLPREDLLLALLLFNLGVEAGQVVFIGLVVVAWQILRRVAAHAPQTLATPARLAPAYVIGPYAAFLFIERLGATFQ